jgi:membrane-associated phospholipid phosphatase
MKKLMGSNLNPAFFSGYLIFVCILSAYCISINKSEGFLLINQFHYRLMDDFFILFTNLGNGIFAILLMVFLLIRKRTGWSMQMAFSFLFSGIIAQFLKHLVHSPRPKLFFGPGSIHYIHGITGTGYGSFPSGHTATIFALATLFSFYFPGRNTGIVFIVIALLTGFSRIYLSQHFPVDVLAGSIVGVSVSVFVHQMIPLKTFQRKYSEKDWDHESVNLR